MRNTIKIILFTFMLIMIGCQKENQIEQNATSIEENDRIIQSQKIQVLNFATPHLSLTNDANSSQINLNDPTEKQALENIVQKIVDFNPTIICLELEPKNNDYIASTFKEYKNDQSKGLNYSAEVNAIGLEVARRSGIDRIYGIDHISGFDYPSLNKIAYTKNNDSLYLTQVLNNYKRVNKLKLKEQINAINTCEYKMETFNLYNFLATQHTPDKREGTKEISKFYERNLIMFSNLNDIKMTKDDRVFILLGATHTAYFDIFLNHSHKFELENALNYL